MDDMREAFEKWVSDELDPNVEPMKAAWLFESFEAGYQAALASKPQVTEGEVIAGFEDARKVWNASADEYNQDCNLGEDERRYIYARAFSQQFNVTRKA